ncbi:helix-turn-helix transcriptional regulator [Modestobacter sp. Leaf380]|uniref:helix-turn-helix transcriptional regulator n=1 Tax=Modestobacter sp. Leaf380 TaxID=1736356 RepID=UPI0009E8CBFD
MTLHRSIPAADGHFDEASEASISPPTLAQLRRVAGFTAAGLATELGVSRSTIAHWEAGTHSPAPSYQTHLARLLKTAPGCLTEALVGHPPAARMRSCSLI